MSNEEFSPFDDGTAGKDDVGAALRAGPSASQPRRRYAFFTLDVEEIDPDMGLTHDVEVGLVVLNPTEEEAALMLANGSQAKSTIELTKMALRFWDGRRVQIENSEHESLWAKMGPKARNILGIVFNKMWGASDKGVAKGIHTFRIEIR